MIRGNQIYRGFLSCIFSVLYAIVFRRYIFYTITKIILWTKRTIHEFKKEESTLRQLIIKVRALRYYHPVLSVEEVAETAYATLPSLEIIYVNYSRQFYYSRSNNNFNTASLLLICSSTPSTTTNSPIEVGVNPRPA